MGLASGPAPRRRPDRGKGGKERVLFGISGLRPLHVSPWTLAMGLPVRILQLKGSHFSLNKDFLICLTNIPQTIANLDST